MQRLQDSQGTEPPALPSAATLLAVLLRLLLTRRATGTCFIDSKVLLHLQYKKKPHRVPIASTLPPLHHMLDPCVSSHESTFINMGHIGTRIGTHLGTHTVTDTEYTL